MLSLFIVFLYFDRIYLLAVNQVQQYFIAKVFVNNQQLFGGCEAVGLIEPTKCSVQYTTDSLYRNLSAEVTGLLNTDIPLPGIPVPETTYYFVVSLRVGSTFRIIDRIPFTFIGQGGKEQFSYVVAWT